MSETHTKPLTGSCLCEAVRWTARAQPLFPGHCHCSDCRKTSGTGHMSLFGMPAAAFEVQGEVRFFAKPAASGNVVRRGFCPTCGSFVYSTNDAMPDLRFLSVNSMDEPERFAPSLVVWSKRQLSWDQHAGDLPRFETNPSPEEILSGSAG